jgi:hypothetical protein
MHESRKTDGLQLGKRKGRIENIPGAGIIGFIQYALAFYCYAYKIKLKLIFGTVDHIQILPTEIIQGGRGHETSHVSLYKDTG